MNNQFDIHAKDYNNVIFSVETEEGTLEAIADKGDQVRVTIAGEYVGNMSVFKLMELVKEAASKYNDVPV